MGIRVKNHNLQWKKATLNMTKIIMLMYILTGIFLFLLALLMYKLDLGEAQIKIGIILIMVCTTFIGGIIAAKSFQERRFIFGGATGILYFLILVFVSLLMNKESQLTQEALTLFFICAGGGTLGGMLG